ncbi:MAG: hypothetical protein J5675_04010 [Bacteroidales bacterium]|nr:hypothetical protein [Bacteroidales bacterium]
MRRFSAIVFTLFLALGLKAQGLEMLDRVKDSRASFHYTYLLSRDGGEFARVTDGDVTVEDNAYVLEGLGLKVTSDGKTRLSVDPQAREAVVETVQKEDIFTNPALFIGSWRKYSSRLKVNSCTGDSMDVTLVLDDDTLARFVLSGISFTEKQGMADFSTDFSTLPSDYFLTDLR